MDSALSRRLRPSRAWTGRLAVAALGLAAAVSATAAAERSGLVDASRFVRTVGEERVRLKVALSGSLLRAVSGADPELKRLAGGLESINALILDVSDPDVAARARKSLVGLRAELTSQGWEEVAEVHDEDGADINLLVLHEGEVVRGLVVLLVDTSDEEPSLVFANVVGTLDLAAIEKIGEGFDVPGLDGLDLDK